MLNALSQCRGFYDVQTKRDDYTLLCVAALRCFAKASDHNALLYGHIYKLVPDEIKKR